MVFKAKETLEYLDRKPMKVSWKIIAGGELSSIQRSDVIFDNYDCRIRQLPEMFDD